MPFDGRCKTYALKMIQATQQFSRPQTHTESPTICHVIHTLDYGGAQILVDMLMRQMDGYRSVVAVLDDVGEIGAQLADDGFTVEHIQRQSGIDRQCARVLREFADREGASLFHAHQYTPFFQCMLSRGLLGGRPIVFTEHGRHFPDLPSRKRSIVNRLLLRRSDRLIGVGEAVRLALIQNEGLPANRVEVVYNGVDLEALAKPSPGAREKIRQELELKSDQFVLTQVARLHQLKDHQTALRAIAGAVRAVPHLHLLIVGDGEERAAIEQGVKDLELQKYVTLTGTRTDIADVLAAADCFLLTSISEGIPLTIIEAMAAGIPVISTGVGGVPEMINHGETGFLTNAGDADGLAVAITKLCQEPELCEQVARNAIATAAQQFSLQRMLAGYAAIYEEVLSGC